MNAALHLTFLVYKGMLSHEDLECGTMLVEVRTSVCSKYGKHLRVCIDFYPPAAQEEIKESFCDRSQHSVPEL